MTNGSHAADALGIWAAARRILCIRLDAMGDVLMTSPAIRAVKESTGTRHITLLTSPAGAEVGKLVPEIDEVIAYDAPWVKATSQRMNSGPEWSMIRRLKRQRFDAAIIFTVYSQNPLPAALLCYLADIPLRLAHCHENPYQLLSDWVSDPEPAREVRHEVRRQLDLVSIVGCETENEKLSLQASLEAQRKADRALSRLQLDSARRWLLIHPGATAPSRRYPAESFAEVASILSNQYQCQIVFTGNMEERELIEQIRGAIDGPSHSLAGQLSVEELAAVIARSPLLVSNNTGAAHIASAVGTPVVDLYALTNPQHTPWRIPSRVLFHDVPCRNCYKSVCPEGHHNCLRLVKPARVVSAATELLDGGTHTAEAQDGKPLRI